MNDRDKNDINNLKDVNVEVQVKPKDTDIENLSFEIEPDQLNNNNDINEETVFVPYSNSVNVTDEPLKHDVTDEQFPNESYTYDSNNVHQQDEPFYKNQADSDESSNNIKKDHHNDQSPKRNTSNSQHKNDDDQTENNQNNYNNDLKDINNEKLNNNNLNSNKIGDKNLNNDGRPNSNNLKNEQQKTQNDKKASNKSLNQKPDNINSQNQSVGKSPSGLNKRRENLKNKWDNRPKTPKDFANRAKNGIKNRAKNRYNNSGLGKAINNGKKAIQGGKKAAQKTKVAIKSVGTFLKTPAGIITLGVIVGILLILVIVIMVPSMFASGSPQVGGEVQNEENYNKYSEVDQKTIEKLKTASQKYSSGNPSYAMAATLYPYMDEMQNGNVSSIRGKTNISQSDDEDVYDEEDNSDESDNEDLEESKNDTISNDPYLELFRKRKYRKKFKKLLKISKDGDDALTEYLKNTWFKKDAGYKELFDGVKDQSALADAIISDIQDQKDDFKGYFYDNCSTTYSSQSTGQITVDYSNSDGISLQELLTKNIMVDVKKSSCTETAKFKNCESMYSNPISMKQYVIGVTIQEVSDDLNNVEHIKANMIAEKSFAIGRAFQRGNVSKIDDSTYVVGIIDSTRDQDYCDYLTGDSCSDGVKNSYKNYSSNLEQAWSESQNMYLSSGKKLIGSVCQNKSYANACSCKTGKCLFQDEVRDGYKTEKVDAILGDQFKNAKAEVITSESGYLSGSMATPTTTCDSNLASTDGDIGIADDKFKFYFQNDYPNVAFCGATDSIKGCYSSGGSHTICTSGCGVTSYAMLVSNLSGNTPDFDPIKANNDAAGTGGCIVGIGTLDSLFTKVLVNKHTGFKVEQLQVSQEGVNKALQALKDGALIVANVQANSKLTTGGHWVVFRGIASDGKVKIADPNKSNNNKYKTYDLNKLVSEKWLYKSEDNTNHSWFAVYGPKSEEIKKANEAIKSSDSSDGGIAEYNGTGKAGVTTGTLKSPLKEGKQTNSEFIKSINGNPTNLCRRDGTYHGALDLLISRRTNVYAMDGGVVTKVDNNCSEGNESCGGGYGNRIYIKHSKNGKIYVTVYAHLTKGSVAVKVGDKVAKSQYIAKSGNTGHSTGPHLHVELDEGENCIGRGDRSCGRDRKKLNVKDFVGKNISYIGAKGPAQCGPYPN